MRKEPVYMKPLSFRNYPVFTANDSVNLLFPRVAPHARVTLKEAGNLPGIFQERPRLGGSCTKPAGLVGSAPGAASLCVGRAEGAGQREGQRPCQESAMLPAPPRRVLHLRSSPSGVLRPLPRSWPG
ncbi:hypothetical protein P7K49_012188 [Saguinus oedipus]|uniref:Uncharacterized protein n=1 Tax=Saguinus oedipus TaxID=9490 RepID=A0ABQ9VSS4_SAGOE|nr:hypothetical protein P7K49_012188 [Saguinus oedipus]